MDETILLNKIFAIGMSSTILIYALIQKKHSKSWVTPAVLFSLFWFCFTFFPLVFMFSVPISPWGTVLIVFCVFIFGLPSLLTRHKFALAMNTSNKYDNKNIYGGTFLRTCFYIIQIFVILCVFVNLSLQGLSVENFINSPLETANKYLNLRYSGDIQPNIFAQVGVLLNYTGVCIGGLILNSKKRKISIFFLSFIPAALHMIIYADKGTLFLCIAFFYAGIIVSRLNHGDTTLTNRKSSKTIFYSLVILTPILIFSFLARGIGSGDASQTVDNLIYYLSSYAFGHLYAFSDWFSSYLLGESSQVYFHDKNMSWGFSTFMAIFRLLGDTTSVPDGYYDEYFQYKNLLKTNIYTIYRGLIQDFGVIGTILYMLLSGTLFNTAYLLILKRKTPILSTSIYICMVGYIYTSFIISIMIWNSIFGVLFLLSMILMINVLLFKFQHRLLIATTSNPSDADLS